jgi:hypothetical protein
MYAIQLHIYKYLLEKKLWRQEIEDLSGGVSDAAGYQMLRCGT